VAQLAELPGGHGASAFPLNMRPAVLGIRAHSGWAAGMTVGGVPPDVEVLARRRVAIVDAAVVGSNQPYHFASEMELSEADHYLAQCAAIAQKLASAGISSIVAECESRGFRVSACAILAASARPLPPLPEILAAHTLIHTAEGEFFRDAFARACSALSIPVTRLREKELDAFGREHFGVLATQMQDRIAHQGKILGPPWTQDQKLATFAASLVLAGLCSSAYSKSPAASLD